MLCTDWEMGESYRRWKRQYGDGWEAKFRNKYEREMIDKFDTHFFVGQISLQSSFIARSINRFAVARYPDEVCGRDSTEIRFGIDAG
jgi:PhoPQ-activated pathogenicity-related protein